MDYITMKIVYQGLKESLQSKDIRNVSGSYETTTKGAMKLCAQVFTKIVCDAENEKRDINTTEQLVVTQYLLLVLNTMREEE